MVFIEHNSLKSDIFLIPYLFHVFQGSCFLFRVQVFQSSGFSGSRFRIRVQVLEVVENIWSVTGMINVNKTLQIKEMISMKNRKREFPPTSPYLIGVVIFEWPLNKSVFIHNVEHWTHIFVLENCKFLDLGITLSNSLRKYISSNASSVSLYWTQPVAV